MQRFFVYPEWLDSHNPKDKVEVVKCSDHEQALAEKDREIAKWKAAHAEMVSRNKLLRDRPDLPADRIYAHDEWVEKYQQLMEKAVLFGECLTDACRCTQEEVNTSPECAFVRALLFLKSPEVQAWWERKT